MNVFQTHCLTMTVTQMLPVMTLKDRLLAVVTQVSAAMAPAVLTLTNVQQTLIIATIMQPVQTVSVPFLARAMLAIRVTAHIA